MGIKKVETYFQENNFSFEVFEFETSTATVELAAGALGVEPDLIAKTMSFKLKNEENILVVAAGEKRVDNRKFKDCFQSKARMLNQDEVLAVTGHPVGGVCPFALKNKLKIYLDISLKKYQCVYPAAGSPSSAVKITPEQLQEVTGGEWVDVCK